MSSLSPRRPGDDEEEEEIPEQPTKSDDEKGSEDNNGRKKNKKRSLSRKEQFDALHQEMELVVHGVAKSGQSQRKVPRHQSIERTQKRKLLEQQDNDQGNEGNKERYSNGTHNSICATTTSRVRGSKAAAGDGVIQGSLIFGGNTKRTSDPEEEEDEAAPTSDDDDDEEEDKEFTEQEEGEDDDEETSDDDEEEDVDDAIGDPDAIEEDIRAAQEAAPQKEVASVSKATKAKKPPKIKSSLGKPKRKRTQRLRNFRSCKMAEKHGAALGALVRGKPGLAIRKLKQVAASAPSAPQIYSSLGMVYEDMLYESQRKAGMLLALGGSAGVRSEVADLEEDAAHRVDDDAAHRVEEDAISCKKVTGEARVSFRDDDGVSTDRRVDDMEVQDKALRLQLSLAKKAYGSYHIAAILCKRDFSLWLRAADSAFEIAALHTTIMQLPEITDDAIEYHRAEKHRWLEEARSDYQIADNLDPPGIDIPAKLAQVMIEVGLLSESLTLLTHLKKEDDFDSSYRAWLLYSDLMLRIGHECMQWNRGVQTNRNYMFRRWLRKHSATFDWRERRMQALAKALEAACGSQCCHKFINWLQNRVEAKVPEAADGNEDPDVAQDTDASESGAQSPGILNDRAAETSAGEWGGKDAAYSDDYGVEKELLLRTNRTEIAAFDKTTKEMDLDLNSVPAKEREVARSDLVMQHRAALVTLVGEFHHQRENKQMSSPGSNSKSMGVGAPGRQLTLSASCRTVFTIASELMRHLLDMQLYDGGRLAGESVSLYLKERAALRDKRKQAGLEFDQAQQRPISIFAMQHEAYDATDQHSDDDDESNAAPLSDDDDLDNSDDVLVMGPLRNGTLPPEIRFLYGLCLAGEGEKAFVAVTCIQAINDLPQEQCSWLSEKIVDTSVATDSLWILFHREKTQPFGRITALAFAADVLHKSGKERELSNRVAALFRRHIPELTGMLDVVLRMNGRSNLISSQRRNYVVKVLVAETRYEVERAEALLSRHASHRDGSDQSSLGDAIDSLSKLLPVVWRVDSDGSISSTSSEAVDALSRTFRLFSSHAHELEIDRSTRQAEAAVNKMIAPVSILCGAVSLTINDSIERSTSELTSFPLPSSWLSSDLASLSLRAFNLCVGTNVSLFSGWEPEEFSVRLLRGGAHNFFGIVMDDGQVAGYVSEANEEELAQQWELVRSCLPKTIAFDFRAKLKTLRESAWYKETRERYKATQEKHRIVFYEEDGGLSALLSFSRVCLVYAHDARVQGKPLFIALSILLPISQFCLNESLWDARIGQQAASGSSGIWRDFSTLHKNNDQPAPSFRPGYIRPSKRATSSISDSGSERALHEWFSWEDDLDPMSNLIAVPLPKLQRAWRRWTDPANRERAAPASGVDLMQELDLCIAKLRSCHTLQAVEKASLHVAASLLRLITCPECCNPFACLQQAAMFASQAQKGGTSDHIFQARLPLPEACSPLDALLILGRAECLNALHFCQSAAFLCSYVATICSLHRHDKEAHVERDERWSILAYLAYDLSVMIRMVAGVLLQEQDKRDDTSGTWEIAAINEFRLARVDGLAWKGEAFKRTATNRDCLDSTAVLHHNAVNTLRECDYGEKGGFFRNDSSEERAEEESTPDFVPAMDVLGVEEISDDNSVNATELVAV